MYYVCPVRYQKRLFSPSKMFNNNIRSCADLRLFPERDCHSCKVSSLLKAYNGSTPNQSNGFGREIEEKGRVKGWSYYINMSISSLQAGGGMHIGNLILGIYF